MNEEDFLEQWLREQPLDSEVEIAGETVYLNIHPRGAELGAFLFRSFSQQQLHDSLRQGFSSAMEFPAGLGITRDGESLTLSQWLPEVSNWSEAASALETLLDQLAAWRMAISGVLPAGAVNAAPAAREMKQAKESERRLRGMYGSAHK